MSYTVNISKIESITRSSGNDVTSGWYLLMHVYDGRDLITSYSGWLHINAHANQNIDALANRIETLKQEAIKAAEEYKIRSKEEVERHRYSGDSYWKNR